MLLVRVDSLLCGMVLAQDIFAMGGRDKPLATTGTVVTARLIVHLMRSGIAQVYVRDAAQAEKEDALPPENADTAGAAHSVGSLLLAPALRDEALEGLEEVFQAFAFGTAAQGVPLRPLVQSLESTVNRIVDSLLENRNTLVNLSNLRSHDEFTFHHSLAVAVLSIGVGIYMGLAPAHLKQLGLSAILHDLGKVAIPKELLNKRSPLTMEEYALMKSHSTEGYTRLKEADIGDEELWNSVLHHHERIDGGGYPHGLRGEEIPLFSRIIATTDVYDALTSPRPYRRPMSPSAAVEYLMSEADHSFDCEVVHALLQRVDLYPVGSRVQLSDGSFAEVVEHGMPLRPVVRILSSGEILDLSADRRLLSLIVQNILWDGQPPTVTA